MVNYVKNYCEKFQNDWNIKTNIFSCGENAKNYIYKIENGGSTMADDFLKF